MKVIKRDELEPLEPNAGGSLSAFESFYAIYSDFVYRIALRLTSNRAEAEDICQDVFMEALEKMDQFDPGRGSVEAWLAVKTKSRCLDRLRRKRRIRMEQLEHYYELPAALYEPVEDTVASQLIRERLHQAIMSIPAPQRQAVYGSYFEERTHRELAERLNRPVGSVKSLIRYGLRNIRRQMASHETG
nr:MULTISPECIES: sigma-70 family RNA polymerase sigma factor [unclassified Paenibacillus]